MTDSSDNWPRGGELVDQVAGVAAAAAVGEGDDRVVDRRHPRVELLVEAAGQEPDVGPADRHERPVDGEPLVAALLDDLLEAGGDGEDRLAGAGPAVEGDDRDVGIEQQLEREALLLGARPQAPRLGDGCEQQHELVADAPCRAPTANRTAARRTRSRASVGGRRSTTASTATAPAA